MTPAEIEAWYVNRRRRICQLGMCTYICCSCIRVNDLSEVCFMAASSTCPSRVGFLTRDDLVSLRDPNGRKRRPRVNGDVETHNLVIDYLKGFEQRYHHIYMRGTTISLMSSLLVVLAMACTFDQTTCSFIDGSECEWSLAARVEACILGSLLACCCCFPLPFMLACMFVVPGRTSRTLIFNYNKAIESAIPPTVIPTRLSAIVADFLSPGGYFVTVDDIVDKRGNPIHDKEQADNKPFAVDWLNSLLCGPAADSTLK